MDAPVAPRDPRPAGPGTVLAGLAAVGAVGWLDHVTGPHIGVSLFYLVPIVVVSARAGTAAGVAVAALAAATWFVDDRFDAVDPLPASMWNGATRLAIFVGIGWLVSRQREAVRRLDALNQRLRELADREARLARVDPLTELPNARGFMETLRVELARARRAGHAVALLAVDLDNFKQVNDRHGHERGDECLREAARALRGAVRGADVPARLGGDEFAVLLCDTAPADVDAAAARICAAVAAVGGRYPGCGLGASVGLVHLAEPPADAAELLRLADAAMYEAKRDGKGRVQRAGG